ncbi:MAG: hypothetical protein NC253_14720 [Ruminococcus sp.]|nr:hypothetical protein [Ruminococcus sp.]
MEVYTAVATLKAQITADKILAEFKFDIAVGAKLSRSITKTQMLKYCIKTLNVKKLETVLIGDSKYDVLDAKQTCG